MRLKQLQSEDSLYEKYNADAEVEDQFLERLMEAFVLLQ